MEYSNSLDFSSLPLEIRVKVLATLKSYSECHIELYPNGKRVVTVDWCLTGSDYEKPVIEHQFRKSDFSQKAIDTGYMLQYGVEE